MLERDFPGFGHRLDAGDDGRVIAPAMGDARAFADSHIAMLRLIYAGIIRGVGDIHDEGDARLEGISNLAGAEQTDFLLHIGNGANFGVEFSFGFLQEAQRFSHGESADTVVKGPRDGEVVTEQIKFVGQSDRVANGHKFPGIFAASDTQVDKEVMDFRRLGVRSLLQEMRRDIADHTFDRAAAGVDNDALGFGDGRVHTAHFTHINKTGLVDVINRHGDFVGMSREHEARRTAFVEDGDAVTIGIGEGFVGKLFGIIEPNALTADFMADRARCIDEGLKELKRLNAHGQKIPEPFYFCTIGRKSPPPETTDRKRLKAKGSSGLYPEKKPGSKKPGSGVTAMARQIRMGSATMLWLTKLRLRLGNAAIRRNAVKELCETPNRRAVRALSVALRDGDTEVRRFAVTALGKLEDERRIEPLVAALNDPAIEVQKAAILSLKRTSNKRVIPALVPLLRHTDAGVRGCVAQVLDYLSWNPTNREDEIWLLVAKGKFSHAASFGVPAITALEMVLHSGPYSLCVAAAHALGEIGDQRVVRPLLAALRSSDTAICVAAVDTLAKVGGPKVIEPITALLKHSNGEVRRAAVEALGKQGGPAVVEPLRQMLRDSLWDVRRAAAEGLGRLKGPGALEAISQALQDGDSDVREAAAIALGNLGDHGAIGPLVMALKDSSSGVRRIAAAALSRIDERWSASAEAQGAIAQLKPALQDKDPAVRHFVGSLLVGLGEVEPDVAPAEVVDESAVSLRGKRQKLAVSLFTAMLCDLDRDLRQAAAEALGRLGDRRAESALSRTVGDADPDVRHAAEKALEILGVACAGA